MRITKRILPKITRTHIFLSRRFRKFHRFTRVEATILLTLFSIPFRLLQKRNHRFTRNDPKDRLFLTLCHEKSCGILMPGTTQLLPGKNFLKHMYPMRRTLGALTTTSVQRKQGNNEFGEGEQPNADNKIEPIVAFSKPPPLPPVLGPFIVFSLLEMGSDDDGNDD